MPTELNFARDDDGYLVAEADLTQGTAMFQRAPVLSVVLEIEEFVTSLPVSELEALRR